MPPALEVHHVDTDSVLDAFDELECPAVAIFQGRSLVFSYVGPDVKDASAKLEKQLINIQKSGSEAVHTLRIYLDCEDRKAITYKTSDNGSFNFRLNEPGPYKRRGQYADGPSLTERVMGIEGKLDQLINDEGEGEEITGEPVGLIGQVMEVIKNPEAMTGIMQIIGGIREMFAGKPIPVLSGLPGDNSDPIAILTQYDPDILNDLKLLARLAQKDKAQFDSLIRMLRSMNL